MSLVRLNPRHKRSPKNLLLNDVFSDWDAGYGIFSFLNNNTVVPWENTSALGLDIAYHGEQSGNKFISPLVYRWIDENGEITSAGIQKLITAIEARYYQKWKHLWEVYSAEYSPLDTYNMTESGSSDSSRGLDESNTRTPNLTESHSGTDNLARTNDEDTTFTHGHVVTNSGVDTTTTNYGKVTTDDGDPTSSTTEQVFGFNSSTFEDKSKSTSTSHTDNVQTLSGNDEIELEHGKVETNSGNDRTILDQDGTENRTLNLTDTTTGTDVNVKSVDEGSHEEFSSTKRGNMYRAPAELLSLDRDFWLQDYFTIVFADVDDMLTLDIYPEREPVTKVF